MKQTDQEFINTMEGDDASQQIKSDWRTLADKLTKIGVKQLITSSEYKKPRMEQIKKYERLYNNEVPKKVRQLFNIPIPVFSGMIDQMASDFDEPISLKFKDQDPSDYFKARKVTACWEMQRTSTAKDSKWDQEVRLDKKNAIFSGRGVVEYYADSDPEYTSHFKAINYKNFHCQPRGGPNLEKHLFAGVEGITKTKSDLIKGVVEGIYDKQAVADLVKAVASADYEKKLDDDKLARFQALKQDPNGHSYVGETTFYLCKWVLTYGGTKYYLLFDPVTQIGIRCQPLKEVYSSGRLPWKSWATHEDDEVFWSKSYADDIYPIADTTMTLVNQELTNREKRNFGARAYDKDMFKDLNKLDSAQFRPDALVPADTKKGVKKIADGIYRFDTPELQGTINLADWLTGVATNQVGIGELGGLNAKGAKPSVIFAQKQRIAKRLSYKSAPFSECYAEVGQAFIQGLKDHMPQAMAIRMIGPDGIEWDEITKLDLNTKRDLDIEIISGNRNLEDDKLKKDARVEAVKTIISKPLLMKENNPKMLSEIIWRDIGGYTDLEIKNIMDTSNYGDKESVARAVESIQVLLSKKEPKIFYGANTRFMQIIQDYAVDHRSDIGMEMYRKFMEYVKAHAKIAHENMMRKASIRSPFVPDAKGGQGGDNGGNLPPELMQKIQGMMNGGQGGEGGSPIPSADTGANNMMLG